MTLWLIAAALAASVDAAPAPAVESAPAPTTATAPAPAPEATPAPKAPSVPAPAAPTRSLKLDTSVAPPVVEKKDAPGAVPAKASGPADIVDLFYSSLVEGYTEMALAQLAPEVVIYETGYEEHGISAYALGHVQEDAVFAAGAPRKQVRRESGQDGDTAWVLSQYEIRGQFGERRVALNQTETVLLRRMPEGWRIAHIHWSAHTPEEK